MLIVKDMYIRKHCTSDMKYFTRFLEARPETENTILGANKDRNLINSNLRTKIVENNADTYTDHIDVIN